VAGLLLSSLIAAPAATQEPTAPAATYEGSAEVGVVEVPVQVIRDGKPVRGLTQADFTVFAAKQKQPLLGFEVVDLSLLDAATPAPVAAPVTVDLPAAGRRHFLFLFDLSSADPHALGRAQDAALDVVRTALTPADLAAVAVYSPARGAKVLLAFTTDRAQLELALETLGSSELVEHRADWLGLTIGFSRDKLRVSQTMGGRPGGAPGGDEGADSGPSGRQIAQQEVMKALVEVQQQEERGQAQNEQQRAQNFSRSLRDMADLMQRIDGRKYVVLLSEGFDSAALLGDQKKAATNLETDEDGQSIILRGDSNMRFGSSKLQSSFRQTIEEMRRADCVVHAIDIGRASSGTRAIDSELTEVGAGDPQLNRRGEETLFALANGTGGSLYRNFNDVGAAMRKVLDVSAVTYLLTIPAPQTTATDGYVPLRVEVRGTKASEVSARAGFYTKPTALQQMAMAERLRIGAQVIEGRAGGDVKAATIGVPLPMGDAGGTACAVVEVDGASLLYGHVGDMVSAEVMVYAFDKAGTIHAVARQLVGLDLTKVGDKLRGTGFKLFANLDLPAGEYQLRTLVRNTISNRYGIAVAPLVVPAEGAGTALAGVFLEPPGRDWLLVRDTTSERPFAYPFTVGEKVMVPAAAPKLHAGEAATLWIEAPTDAAALEGVVKRGDGAVATNAALQLGERAQSASADRMLATFSPAGLPPGGYTLEVRVPGSAAAPRSLSFSVE
jgi:VWFA-related protein